MANNFSRTPAVTRSVARDACRRNRANRSRALSLLRSRTNSARTIEQATRRRAARAAILAERRRSRHSDESSVIRDHYRRMRTPRHNTPFHQEPVFKGIREFNSPIDEDLVTTFLYNDLTDERNHVCRHCESRLWKEEKRFSCCKNGEYAIHKLRDIPLNVWNVYNTPEFRQNQRKYNSLFSFTALSAGGVQKRTWTQPSGVSMLTMHGRAYHRIFDLQQHYAGMNVANSSRYYIYDSEFNSQYQALHVNNNTAGLLRS